MLLRGVMRRKIVPNDILISEVARMVAEGGQVTLLTKGQSMLPFIIGGRDSVELSPIREDDIATGDIILARITNPTRYVIHRVIELTHDGVVLMGDGNIMGVERCPKGDVLARVTAIIKPKKVVDPRCESELKKARLWWRLLPIRRYILAILRRL